jgi:hypothetical protein
MLRKQCASCHIGQTKTEHTHDVMWDRGGGCLACHVAEYPENAHPALTASVSDARCFGCHARSGRISLNYTGLAEVDTSTLKLPDGRPIERRPADVHYQAGMSCIDCHTSVGLMGSAGDALHQRQTVDISCADCHDNPSPNLTTEKNGMEYDADGEQWDHVERALTPGRWSDELWHVRNTLPALGVNEDDQIELYVPGMIMTVAHPEFEEEKFVRMFAPLSPHTTGKSRTCESCHRSSEALGLGQGKLTNIAGETVFEPAHELLRDGLPADAWTNIGNSLGGRTPSAGQRPLNETEMDAMLNAVLPDQ